MTREQRPRGTEAPRPGDRIGDYELVRRIGHGSMGEVWEARQVSLDRTVALKLLHPGRLDAEGFELFAREARAGSRLHSPNIVETLDFGQGAGRAWIAQELVEGRTTLKDRLDTLRARVRLPVGHHRSVVELVAKLAEALTSVHAAGVVHRDIKPVNVLIASDGEPKLSDFGIARIVDESKTGGGGTVVGTWAYMSPEQARGTVAGPQSDVFSLGVVLYELLTLRRPFEGDTPQQVVRRILTEDPPPVRAVRSRVPTDLAVICAKSLEKSPQHRYGAMDSFARDLRRFLADEPIAARPAGLSLRLQKWLRRNPARAVAWSSIVAALLAVTVLLLALQRKVSDLGTRGEELTQANEELRARTERLVVASHELEEQGRNLQHMREQADRRAQAETARAAEVLQLSALQILEDLESEVETLWPAHPEEIQRLEEWALGLQSLASGLEAYRAKREKLQARAMRIAGDDLARRRRGSPDALELAQVEARLVFAQRCLAQRRDGFTAPLPELDDRTRGESPQVLESRARARVHRGRTRFGEESLGLALALRAREVATDAPERYLGTLGWALFAVGRDKEALETMREARDQASADTVGVYRGFVESLEELVAEASTASGIARQEQQIADLESQRAELLTRLEAPLFEFPESEREAAWWTGELTTLIDGIEALERRLLDPEAVDEEYGWSIPRRLAFARELNSGFRPGGELASAWDAALPSLRAAYPGTSIRPQTGLLPIGPDPESGLWEFLVLGSGEPPLRSPEGRLQLTEETGIVLVLLPGSSFRRGSSPDPTATNYNPDYEFDEMPCLEVHLRPFFISKYEWTQAQWMRIAGTNPSTCDPRFAVIESLLHPVETVSWEESMAVARRLGLTLPSEAQWEFAARGGTSTVFWTGDDRDSLVGFINIADQAAARIMPTWPEIAEWPELDDGSELHSVVDRYPPNPFGLHSVHGNVSEWCLDAYDAHFYATGPLVDPVCDRRDLPLRVTRGSNCARGTELARSAFRSPTPRGDSVFEVGLRPARALDL